MNKIEVRPIDRKRWHGKKGKESFTRPKKITALVDADTMRYATGLSEDEETKYSKELNKDLSSLYDPEKSHPFWDSSMATIKLENATKILDPNKPLDFIHYRILKASKFVANSIKEYEEGLFPEATHVIFNESESVEVEAKKIEIEKQAIIKAEELSPEQKGQIVLILTGKNSEGKSNSFIEVALSKEIKKNPKEVLRYIHLIEEDADFVATKALVEACLLKSVLMKKGHKILYFDSVLGGDVEEVTKYLLKSENQGLKIRLMEGAEK